MPGVETKLVLNTAGIFLAGLVPFIGACGYVVKKVAEQETKQDSLREVVMQMSADQKAGMAAQSADFRELRADLRILGEKLSYLTGHVDSLIGVRRHGFNKTNDDFVGESSYIGECAGNI